MVLYVLRCAIVVVGLFFLSLLSSSSSSFCKEKLAFGLFIPSRSAHSRLSAPLS